MYMLALDGVPDQVDCVSDEAETEGITMLLYMLCRETHPLVDDLLYLVRYNTREIGAHIDWMVESTLLPMN